MSHFVCVSDSHPCLQYVCNQLSVEFAVCCDRSNILDLDSTTDRKFSRHLIFHIPKAVFRTNLHAGIECG